MSSQYAPPLGYGATLSRVSNDSANASPSSASTFASSPQSNGLDGGGAGWNGDMILNMSCTPGPGVQHASATRPPGFTIRASSAAVASWSGANMIPTDEPTASNDASSTSRLSQSPTR